jgi:hypothetical protein
VQTAIETADRLRARRRTEEIAVKASLQAKRQQTKASDSVASDETKGQTKLAEDEKKSLEKEIKSNAEYVRDAVEELSNFKKQLDGLKKARGVTQ